MPVIEAMACGAPVLTSNVSSLPEVAGEAAVQVDPLDEDAIRSGLQDMIESPSLLADLREAGRTQAARFSWRSTAESTMRVFEKVLQ